MNGKYVNGLAMRMLVLMIAVAFIASPVVAASDESYYQTDVVIGPFLSNGTPVSGICVLTPFTVVNGTIVIGDAQYNATLNSEGIASFGATHIDNGNYMYTVYDEDGNVVQSGFLTLPAPIVLSSGGSEGSKIWLGVSIMEAALLVLVVFYLFFKRKLAPTTPTTETPAVEETPEKAEKSTEKASEDVVEDEEEEEEDSDEDSDEDEDSSEDDSGEKDE